MYKEVLQCLSTKELHENYSRLSIACEELKDCLESLLEEKDELLSCNQMYKFTTEEFKKLNSVEYFKKFEQSTTIIPEIPAKEPEESKQVCIEIIEEQIEIPKSSRISKDEIKPIIPKLKIQRPQNKRYV